MRVASISRAKTTSVANRRGRIEPREMLGAQNGGFPSDRRVARTMNALFPIRADAKIPDGLKALDNPDKVLLAWRFRPFAQPRERRSVLIVVDRDQRFQSCNRLMCQALRRGSCAPAFGRERAAAKPICSKVTAAGSKILSHAQMIDHGGNNGIAAIRARCFFKRSLATAR